jgi:hypothetical protein
MLLRKDRQDIDAFRLANLKDEKELFNFRVSGDGNAHASSSRAIKNGLPVLQFAPPLSSECCVYLALRASQVLGVVLSGVHPICKKKPGY